MRGYKSPKLPKRWLRGKTEFAWKAWCSCADLWSFQMGAGVIGQRITPTMVHLTGRFCFVEENLFRVSIGGPIWLEGPIWRGFTQWGKFSQGSK
jgi:hypothetical protein